VQTDLSWRRAVNLVRAGGLVVFVLLALGLRAEGARADDAMASRRRAGWKRDSNKKSARWRSQAEAARHRPA
jgi:hypothetical protein